ncbi:MAG: DUF2225 domain-containing protein [Deltaproteobacteria bacterium]
MTENSPYYEKKYICPVCNTEFKTYAVRSSRAVAASREADFHTIYSGVSPLHYTIVVCPGCYYAASNNTFGNEIEDRILKPLAQALVQIRPTDPPDYLHERNLDVALRSYELAIRSTQLKKGRPGEMAGLFLGAAWMAREKGNSELDKEYCLKGLQCYLEAFNRDFRSIGNMSDVQATYLVGELYRRTDNYAEAINWFGKAVFNRAIKQNPQLEKLAREQWALAKEQATSSGENISAATEVVQEAPVIAEKEPKPNLTLAPASRRRTNMQMNASLYADQIDWLNHIVNRGYDYSKTLVPREQVLRALLDSVIEKLGEKPDVKFKTETELKSIFDKLLSE